MLRAALSTPWRRNTTTGKMTTSRTIEPIHQSVTCGLLSATIAALLAMPGSAPRMMSNCALMALTEPSSGRRCCCLDAVERGGERRETRRRPLEALADDDQRGRQDEHDDHGEHDGQEREQMGAAHLPPNPSVSAFM